MARLVELCLDAYKRQYGYGSRQWNELIEKNKIVEMLAWENSKQYGVEVCFNDHNEGKLLHIPVSLYQLIDKIGSRIKERSPRYEKFVKLVRVEIQAGEGKYDKNRLECGFKCTYEMYYNHVVKEYDTKRCFLTYREVLRDKPMFGDLKKKIGSV